MPQLHDQAMSSPGSVPIPSGLSASTVEAILASLARHAGSVPAVLAACGALANILDLDRVTGGRVSRLPPQPGLRSSARKSSAALMRPVVHATVQHQLCEAAAGDALRWQQQAAGGSGGGGSSEVDQLEAEQGRAGEGEESTKPPVQSIGIAVMVSTAMLRHKGSPAVQEAACAALRNLFAHSLVPAGAAPGTALSLFLLVYVCPQLKLCMICTRCCRRLLHHRSKHAKQSLGRPCCGGRSHPQRSAHRHP